MSDLIMIQKARVNFPFFFSFPTFQGKETNAGCRIMLDPKTNAKTIAEIRAAIQGMFDELNKGKKLPPDKLCLREGNDTGRDEEEGLWILSARAKANQLPLVLSPTDPNIVVKNESDQSQRFYSGCYCNLKVRLWFQDHPNYGKRVNCELLAVQWAGDGEPLSAGVVSKDKLIEGFSSVTTWDDADETEEAF